MNFSNYKDAMSMFNQSKPVKKNNESKISSAAKKNDYGRI